MRNFIILLQLLWLLACGTNNTNELTMISDKADGIREETDIVINGYSVGKVASVTLTNDYKIQIQMDINSGISIPTDSRIVISDADFFGTKMIVIEPGSNEIAFQPTDTIDGFSTVDKNSLQNISNFIQSLPATLDSIEQSKNDSLLIELRRLNSNLEELLNAE